MFPVASIAEETKASLIADGPGMGDDIAKEGEKFGILYENRLPNSNSAPSQITSSP